MIATVDKWKFQSEPINIQGSWHWQNGYGIDATKSYRPEHEGVWAWQVWRSGSKSTKDDKRWSVKNVFTNIIMRSHRCFYFVARHRIGKISQ